MREAGPGTQGATPAQTVPRFDVVALAASAGGLDALMTVLAGLPGKFPAAILVVQHMDRTHPSMMSSILSRRSELPVTEAREGERIRAGHVYIARPNYHLTVRRGRVALTSAEAVHFVRPSADVLFQSTADNYGPRAIVVVLTGTGTDGAAGAQAMNRAGGIVIAQDEATAKHFGMPGAAIRQAKVDYVLPLGEIPRKLMELVGGC